MVGRPQPRTCHPAWEQHEMRESMMKVCICNTTANNMFSHRKEIYGMHNCKQIVNYFSTLMIIIQA